MKLLFGTGNPAKLSLMQKTLESLGIELIGLKDLESPIPDVPETGTTPLENARLTYYAGLAHKYGTLTAHYKNAICFILDEGHSYEAMDASIESERFLIAETPHSAIRKAGFPLDSLSIDIKTGKYYYDLPKEQLDQVAAEDGFFMFFKRVLEKIG